MYIYYELYCVYNRVIIYLFAGLISSFTGFYEVKLILENEKCIKFFLAFGLVEPTVLVTLS